MERRIDIDRARREAKALLRAARAGDPEARSRIRSDREPCLSDAQHAVARALGERSWPALVGRVGALGRGLLDAAREGRADDVQRLLEAGAPANSRDPESGGTALHVAASRGFLGAVDHLVGWIPVDRQARDVAGRTALGACVEGTADPVVAKVLVSVGLAPEPWMCDRASDELALWLRERIGQPRPEPSGRFADAAWSADASLFRLLARSPAAETRVIGGGFGVLTGQFDNTRNGVVCSRLPEESADAEIASALDWLRERRLPGQWLLESRTEPDDLRARLERAGCRPERSAVHMAARISDLDLSPRRPPADLEIVAIHETQTLAEVLDDLEDAQLFASFGPQDAARLRHYAAQLAGRTVGAASVLIDGAISQVLRLEVHTDARQRGIGRALVVHALRGASAAGSTTMTIGPTPATVPFYEALGLTLERYPADRCYYTPLE
jgi:GNAT superfamily N-acetyltransferase